MHFKMLPHEIHRYELCIFCAWPLKTILHWTWSQEGWEEGSKSAAAPVGSEWTRAVPESSPPCEHAPPFPSRWWPGEGQWGEDHKSTFWTSGFVLLKGLLCMYALQRSSTQHWILDDLIWILQRSKLKWPRTPFPGGQTQKKISILG